MQEAPGVCRGFFAISSADAPPAAPPIAASADSNPASKYRDIFEQRKHAEDDDDDAHDLLGAAVERQQIDQIENENNDEKGDENTYKHCFSPIHAKREGKPVVN